MWLGRVRRVHFVGIGGAGMSALAEILAASGFEVSGSDARPSEVTERLAARGVRVVEGHRPEHLGNPEAVVVSSAVGPTNPELAEAVRRGLPVVRRGELLAELMRKRDGIAVAGAHGKTTTAAMTAAVLVEAGLDPTVAIGGRYAPFGGHARLGGGAHLVAEADESDGSFLQLSPDFAVITNVDREHLDHYGSFEALCEAFVAFANRVPFHGATIVCLDDVTLRASRGRIHRRVVSYGLDADDADVRAEAIRLVPGGGSCLVTRRRPGDEARTPCGELRLRVPGRHNLANAVAAAAVTLELGVPFERIARALAGFAGVDRRFQLVGAARDVTVADDYGHHPTEIETVLSAARTGGYGRVVVVFQPHRYSRTRDLHDEFVRVLGLADVVLLTDVYGAGEDPLPGVDADALAAAIRSVPVSVVRPLSALPAAVADLARAGDLVITLGAGSVGTLGPRILQALDRPGPVARRGA